MMQSFARWASMGLLGFIPIQQVYGVASMNPADYAADDIIRRDVCIIGGGASGTYAAIRLRDSGKSVVLVEKEPQLGGHTNTYVDPQTGDHIDYGVIIYHNTSLVQNYLSRLNVSTLLSNSNDPELLVDLQSGKVLEHQAVPDPSTALQAYAAQLAQYPFLDKGFVLPDPVPKDLLLPFGEFITKYSLENAARMFNTINQGYGNILEQTTLYMLKIFGLSILTDTFIASATGNEAIHTNARAVLGHDAYVNSRVIATSRTSHGVCVLIKTPTGPKLILAKTLILSIPPKLDNLNGFDLSRTEESLFSQFNNSAYYTSVVANVNLPNSIVTNADPNALYEIPSLPGIYFFVNTLVSGLAVILYGSPSALPDSVVQSSILEGARTINKLNLSNDSSSTSGSEPHFRAYSSHTPFGLTVSPQAIANGFYKDLYSLQGQKSTWWTGAAWHTHDSSLLWDWTETNILPAILKALE